MKPALLSRSVTAVRSLFREARRRRVFRMSVAYAGLFFVLAQAASIFFPALQLPDWSVTLVVALGLLGLPVVVMLAWVFDLGREGITRTPPSGGEPTESPRSRWARAHALFTEAVDLSPADRDRFLAREAGGDAGLRREVESLLRAHGETGPLDRLGSDVMTPLLAPLRTPPDDRRSSIPEPDAAGRAPPRADRELRIDDDGPVSRYEVLDKLGDGGMGVVYRGRDTRLQRDVALKFLPSHLSAGPTARKRFLMEARAAAALEHPNICTVHEVGETGDGGLFIAMPLYDGETLDQRLTRGPLHWEEALDVGVQVAQGLERAHEARIIHRDIKPANLCLTAGGVVKILDFGIAKVADDVLTGAQSILGTAAYMSPEQARGDDVDHRSDIWSLGVVLFEMLTGQRLFNAGDRDTALAAIRSADPIPLGRLGGTAPAPVLRVVERMLARRPDERPASASAVLHLLREAAAARDEDADSDPVTTADLAPEGERRQAAVIVMAVAGYSALLERVAPAELEGRLARLRAAMDDIIRRRGGTLNEFAGDRIVAVFGVPVTHEDDALRATRAAADLRQLADLGGDEPGEEGLALRCGIATGTLVAQPSDGGDREYRLAGRPTHVAARIAAQTRPGEILMDAASERLARSRYALEHAGSLPPQEDGDEIVMFRLSDGPADPPRPGAAPARLTAYIGRERELETLLSMFDRATTGDGQVVTVVGEAGVGKSRLVHEFRTRVEERPARIVQGHCEAYTATRPYQPFVEVLQRILGLDSDASSGTAEGDVVGAVRAIDAQLEDLVPFYLHLLSVPTSRHTLPRQLQGEQFRAAMREALTALVTLAAARTPVALILEDWHWVDEASAEVLKQLAEVVATYPLLILVAYRPGYAAEWESTQPRTLIHLSPLGAPESAAMISAMLGVTAPPAELVTALHDRAGGNPFFLEELCQSLQEAGTLRVEDDRASLSGGAEPLHLPTTIQGVLRTRLDRLPQSTRSVVRSAAVIGRDFDLTLLERLGHDRYALDQALAALKEAGIVQQTRVVPERAFRFKHVLTQEVAYDTLLLHQRKVVHRRAGEAIEQLYADRLDEHVARLAHHYSRAEMWWQAVKYGRASARRAQELSEFSDALATLEAVNEWLARLPDDDQRRELEVETLLQQEEICETLGERGRQQQILDRVAGLVDPGSDPGRRIEVYRRQGDVYTLLRRFTEARHALDAALTLAGDFGDVAAQGHVLRSLGLTCWHQGQIDEALEHIQEALRMDRARGDDDATIADLINKAQILKDQGRHEAALVALEQALELLEITPSDLKKSYVLHHMGNNYRALGKLDTALEFLHRADEMTDRRHLPVQRSFNLTAIAHIRLVQDRIDDAIRTYEEAVSVARRARYAEGLAQSLRPLGEVLAGVGRETEALPYLVEAAELFGQLGSPGREAEVWRKTAETAERAGSASDAVTAWTRYLALAEPGEDLDTRLEAREGLARAQRRFDPDPAAARATLMETLELARGDGRRALEARLLNSLGILEWERGEHEAALEAYEAALAAYQELGDQVHAGVILNSLGVTLNALGRFADGRARLEDALETNRATGQRLLEGHSLAALGELSLEAGELDRARGLFETSLEIRRSLGDRTGEGWMHHYLARVCARQGRDEDATAHGTAAREIAAELEDQKLLEACREVEPEPFTSQQGGH